MPRYGSYGSGDYGREGYGGGRYGSEEGMGSRPRRDSFEDRRTRRDSDFFLVPPTHSGQDLYGQSYFSFVEEEARRARSRERSYPTYSRVPRSPSPYRSRFDDRPPPRSPSPRGQSFWTNSQNGTPPQRSSTAPGAETQVPYTYDDEEPDRIPHVAAAWNNFTISSTREELIAFFVHQGFPRAIAEKEVAKEFAAHAPQHRTGQIEPGPSRFAEARSRQQRSPSPPAFPYSQYRPCPGFAPRAPSPPFDRYH